MLVNVILPSGFVTDIEEAALVKVTGTDFNPDSSENWHDIAVYEEYWLGHPARGGVMVKRSAAVTVKSPSMQSDTGTMG